MAKKYTSKVKFVDAVARSERLRKAGISTSSSSSSSSSSYISETSDVFSPYYAILRNEDNSVNAILFNYPIAVNGGVAAYATTSPAAASWYSGMPIDGSTIYWDNGVLKSAGSGETDLSDYYNKSSVDTLLAGKQAALTAGTGIDISSSNVISCTATVDLSSYYTKTQVDNLLYDYLTKDLYRDWIASYQPLLTAGTGIAISSSNVISCTAGGLSVDVINNLTSTSTTAALSAYQGKVLNDALSGKASSSHTHAYASIVKLGTVSYNVSGNTITLPAYPTTLPASDVYSWAKASTKPSYNFSEIGSTPTTLSGYGITDAAKATDLNNYLPLAGGTITGNLVVNGTTNLHDTTITGNLLVTGGVTAYGTSTTPVTFIYDVSSLASYSCTDTYRVASARVISLMKTKVNDNADRLTAAETKIAAIKSALSNITSSSTLADLLSAVINIKNNL